MDMQTALADLSSFLGQRLSRSKSDLDLHGRSESHFPLSPPDAVAYPESTAEVARIVAICARARVPVVGWAVGWAVGGWCSWGGDGGCLLSTQC